MESECRLLEATGKTVERKSRQRKERGSRESIIGEYGVAKYG